MKKLILSMVFVFATGAMLNASSSVEKMNVEQLVLEEVGPASDCVASSKEKAIWAASILGGEPMDYYMAFYIDCFYSIE